MWNKVTDKLPQDIGDILVFGEYNGRQYIAWAFYNSDGKFCTHDGYDNFITHWMPLPAPPKSDTAEAVEQPLTQVKTPAAPTPKGEICPQCGGVVLEELRSGVCQSCGVYYPIKSGKILLT